jgi:hypothetical protein
MVFWVIRNQIQALPHQNSIRHYSAMHKTHITGAHTFTQSMHGGEKGICDGERDGGVAMLKINGDGESAGEHSAAALSGFW